MDFKTIVLVLRVVECVIHSPLFFRYHRVVVASKMEGYIISHFFLTVLQSKYCRVGAISVQLAKPVSENNEEARRKYYFGLIFQITVPYCCG